MLSMGDGLIPVQTVPRYSLPDRGDLEEGLSS